MLGNPDDPLARTAKADSPDLADAYDLLIRALEILDADPRLMVAGAKLSEVIEIVHQYCGLKG